MEDNVGSMQKTMQSLGMQVDTLNARLNDLENRHRRNNLRLVNLPEKAEGADAVRFSDEWFGDMFGMEPGIIERAHRIGRPPAAISPSPYYEVSELS